MKIKWNPADTLWEIKYDILTYNRDDVIHINIGDHTFIYNLDKNTIKVGNKEISIRGKWGIEMVLSYCLGYYSSNH